VQFGHDEIANHAPGLADVNLMGPVVVVFELDRIGICILWFVS